MTRRTALFLLLGASAMSAVAFAQTKSPALTTVPHVDLARYVGRWFEIAKYPARFERDCDRDVTAHYTRLENGEIEVLNECVKEDGKVKASKGKAKVVDQTTNAKLKVTFFWPFSGDYWVIGLSPDYGYAIVGEPGRKYLWILSRAPEMDDATYKGILEQIRSAGYDPTKLIKTRQSARSVQGAGISFSNQRVLNGKEGQFEAVRHSDLVEDVRQMPLDGLLRDRK